MLSKVTLDARLYPATNMLVTKVETEFCKIHESRQGEACAQCRHDDVKGAEESFAVRSCWADGEYMNGKSV